MKETSAIPLPAPLSDLRDNAGSSSTSIRLAPECFKQCAAYVLFESE